MIITALDGSPINFDNVFGITAKQKENGEYDIVAYAVGGNMNTTLATVTNLEEAMKMFREITDGYSNGANTIFLGK